MQKYESLFDGTLGKCTGTSYNIELTYNVKPYHVRPYAVPRAYEQKLKKELERRCKVGVLKRINHSEWAAPTFIIPKKDKTVRFISDFRELNKRISGFQYATSLDLNMGYYHIELSPNSRNLCTIVLT